MLRRNLIILLSVFFLFSCASKKEEMKEGIFNTMQQGKEVTKEVTVNAVLAPEKIPAGTEPKQSLWEEGLEVGMDEILNDLVKEGPIFLPVADESRTFPPPFIQSTIDIEPEQNPITNDYSQQYKIMASFYPDIKLAGQVVSLEKKHSLGGKFSEAFIEFFTEENIAAPAYFVIANEAPIQDKVYYRVFGTGRLDQVFEKRGQATILETNKEVIVGHLVFLLQVNGETTLKKEQIEEMEAEEAAEAGPEEVVVDPEWEAEPIIEEPKEMK